MTAPVDVLAVMTSTIRTLSIGGVPDEAQQMHKARAAVAELIEAVSDAYGDEVNAGRGTCSPGCMSCRIQTALARVKGGAA